VTSLLFTARRRVTTFRGIRIFNPPAAVIENLPEPGGGRGHPIVVNDQYLDVVVHGRECKFPIGGACGISGYC
jgi:hypothetical protein